MTDQIKLSVKDFRAIKRADIKLNGITVVSGVNGCGKSTLSKFVYHMFKFANEYDDIVLEHLRVSLYDIFRFLSIIERESLIQGINSHTFLDYKNNRDYLISDYLVEKREELILHIELAVSKFTDKYTENQSDDRSAVTRLINVLQNTLNVSRSSTMIDDFDVLINQLYIQINKLFYDALEGVSVRPKSLILDEFDSVFYDFVTPDKFNISEYGVPIISSTSNTIQIAHSVQNIAYIDTPMLLGLKLSDVVKHWDDLNGFLKYKNHKKIQFGNLGINNIIQNEIVGGETDFEEETGLVSLDNFLFKRNDGSVFNLLECATGVKSFSILQLLLKNGFLTKNTLLIIDEPEAHLHPQWIVEYARMIVLLNKEVGVKFFIASHSPDMVSAIKYISEKEQTTQNLEYYLAEQTEDNPYLFNYKSLGTNIDPIFESFNIALDRINQYGISNESNDLF